MSVLIVLAIVVLAATALLIVASFVTTADRARDREAAPATADAEEHAAGPDRRAGGPGFRQAALHAAVDPPAGATQRRRLSSRRRRALEAAQAAHVADLSTGDDA